MSQTSWTISHYKDIPSTQDKARDLAKEGVLSSPFVVVAETQSKGRGRHGNQWVSEKGNLYATLHMEPDNMNAEEAGHYAFLMAVALSKTLETYTDRKIQAKWPNDVLVEGKKIAGILLETELQAGKVRHLFIGTGVNIVHSPDYAIHLQALSEKEVVPESFLKLFLNKIDELIDVYNVNGFSEIRKKWLQYAYGIGEAINVRYSDHVISGEFTDIDENGGLLLKLASGETKRITAGEVHFN